MSALHKLLLLHVLTCLGHSAFGGKIIDGKNAPENSMEYMASLQNNDHHICGGFLISKDFVLTAAHCVCRNPTRVVLGAHNLKNTDKTVRHIEKRCIHPSYNHVATGNDIMLLKLSPIVHLSRKVKFIKLPISNMNIKEKENCHVAGWGLQETGGSVVDVLQVVDVPIVNLETCKREWKRFNVNLHANVICAGGYGTRKGACQGDSGGPLVCKETAVGVVSFNWRENCTYPNVPNVYTDISKFLPWINKVLKEKNC